MTAPSPAPGDRDVQNKSNLKHGGDGPPPPDLAGATFSQNTAAKADAQSALRAEFTKIANNSDLISETLANQIPLKDGLPLLRNRIITVEGSIDPQIAQALLQLDATKSAIALDAPVVAQLKELGYVTEMNKKELALLRSLAQEAPTFADQVKLYTTSQHSYKKEADDLLKQEKGLWFRWIASEHSRESLYQTVALYKNLSEACRRLAVLSKKMHTDALAARDTLQEFNPVGDSMLRLTELGKNKAAELARGPQRESLTTLVWSGENEFTSKGKLIEAEMKGVAPGSQVLKSELLHVTGLEQFKPNTKPGDAHKTPTENPDSFDQGVLFHALQQAAERYDTLDMGMSYAQLLALRDGRKQLRAFANSMSDTNAYYSPNSGELHFGTSDGKWDLASDENVVTHEQGHNDLDALIPNCFWNIGDALHEAYGDIRTALLTGNPEISEDFGKVRGGEGTPLRTVENKDTIASTSDEPHDRGNVYSGLHWDIAKYMHKKITGNDWKSGEALNREAADQAMKLLYSYPLHLGTTSPSDADYLRAMSEGLKSLNDGKKLDNRLDVKDLEAFIKERAIVRGVKKVKMETEVGAPIALNAKEPLEALSEALTHISPNALLSAKQHGGTAYTADGSTITRFKILRPVPINGQKMLAEVEDDVLTIIRKGSGEFQAQLGKLPNLCNPGPSGGKASGVSLGAPNLQHLDSVLVSTAVTDFRDVIAKDLQRVASTGFEHPNWLKLHLDRQAPPKDSQVRTEGLYSSSAKFARAALDVLNAKGEKTSLAWKEGQLMLRVDVGEMQYYAPISATGEVGDLIRTCLVK